MPPKLPHITSKWINETAARLQPVIGMDAEVLVREASRTVYPFMFGLPQNRLAEEYQIEPSGCGDIHADGFAWELNTTPMAWSLNVLTAQQFSARKILGYAVGHFKFVNAELYTPVVYTVSNTVYDTAPEEVKVLGCMPSIGVYGVLEPRPAPLPTRQRTLGCHIHVTSPALTPHNIPTFVKWMDVFLGVEDMADRMRSGLDLTLSITRRRAYGRAGEYRMRQYETETDPIWGAEYRVLPGDVVSNGFILNNRGSLGLLVALYMAIENIEPTVFEAKIQDKIFSYINQGIPDLSQLLNATAALSNGIPRVFAW